MLAQTFFLNFVEKEQTFSMRFDQLNLPLWSYLCKGMEAQTQETQSDL